MLRKIYDTITFKNPAHATTEEVHRHIKKMERNGELLDLFVNWETSEQLNMYVREGYYPDIAKKALEIKTSR